MRRLAKTLTLLRSQQSQKAPGVRDTRLALASQAGALANCYTPPPGTRSLGNLLFVHGMTMAGAQDSRQIVFCRALAAAGFTVVAPELSALREARLDWHCVELIGTILGELRDHPSLADKGRVSALAPSVSGGLLLLAAAQRRSEDGIGALCTIGGYGDLGRTLRHWQDAEHFDPYGPWVLVRSFIEAFWPGDAHVREVREALLEDCWAERTEPRWRARCAELSEAQRQWLERLWGEPEALQQQLKRLPVNVWDALADYSVEAVAARLSAPTLLVHGRGDDVIPSSESIALHRALTAAGCPSRLLVSSFLSHGGTHRSPSLMTEAWGLVRAFHWFIAQAEARKGDAGSVSLERP